MKPAFQDTGIKEASYPSLSDRIQSTFIDTVFIVILMFVFASLLDRFENPPDWIRIALFVGIWGIYEPVCTSMGCTLGNYLKNIRVKRRSDTSKRIHLLQALLRYAIKFSLGWLSFLTIHGNNEKRALHDLASGSVVVRK